jgi:hypothetical protein
VSKHNKVQTSQLSLLSCSHSVAHLRNPEIDFRPARQLMWNIFVVFSSPFKRKQKKTGMKMPVLWDVVPCSLVEITMIRQRFLLPLSSGCRSVYARLRCSTSQKNDVHIRRLENPRDLTRREAVVCDLRNKKNAILWLVVSYSRYRPAQLPHCVLLATVPLRYDALNCAVHVQHDTVSVVTPLL